MPEPTHAPVLRALPARPPLGGGARTTPREPGELLTAAAEAALRWSSMTPVARGRALVDLAAEVEGRRTSLVSDVRRSGRPVSAALAEVDLAVDRLVWWAGWADKLDLLPAPAGAGEVLVQGGGAVVLGLVPPARPVLGAVSVLGPVLVTGGACILLPVQGTSRAALLLADAAVVAGVPLGLLTVPHATGPDRTGLFRDLLPGVDVVDARGGAGFDAGELRALRSVAADHDRPLLPPAPQGVPGLAEGSAPDPAWTYPLRRAAVLRL